MPSVRTRTKRPHGALLQLYIVPGYNMWEAEHSWEALKQIRQYPIVEPKVKYQPCCDLDLTVTIIRLQDRVWLVFNWGGCLQRVAEAFKGWLTSDGNRSDSVCA